MFGTILGDGYRKLILLQELKRIIN